MNYYLGVTDNNWYQHLSQINPEDINFWQPGGKTRFRVLDAGAPFLLKLKSPLNVIGGIGFFVHHTFLPLSIAWDTFRERNGCSNLQEFKNRILSYRQDKSNQNPQIGCIVLTNPIFFNEQDWIDVPVSWSKSIVQGKSYSTNEPIGRELWNKVELLLQKYMMPATEVPSAIWQEERPRYGNEFLSRARLGQGAFRTLVTDAYTRRCSISGEKTLPVLQAAHIRPYSDSGPHSTSNGLLLRSDLHKLFDDGYLTVTPNYKIEVSRRIKEEFENGRDYYKYHGENLTVLPAEILKQPGEEFLSWHNAHIFNG